MNCTIKVSTHSYIRQYKYLPHSKFQCTHLHVMYHTGCVFQYAPIFASACMHIAYLHTAHETASGWYAIRCDTKFYVILAFMYYLLQPDTCVMSGSWCKVCTSRVLWVLTSVEGQSDGKYEQHVFDPVISIMHHEFWPVWRVSLTASMSSLHMIQ